MIKLNKLTINNMFSYGNSNELNLSSNRITQLTAPNGSGKSTIALILQELLYSKNIKSIKKADILNRYSKKDTWSGKLEFSVNEKVFNVEIKRTKNQSKVKFYQQVGPNVIDLTEHKIPDTYKKIQEILGLDFEIFSQLTYQSSTDLLEFLKATDTNRKKFLIKLFNLEKYPNIGEVIKLKLSESEKLLYKLDGEMKSIKDFLVTTVIADKKELTHVPSVDETKRQELAKAENKIIEYETVCKKIDKNNLYIKERNNLKFDISMGEPDRNFQLDDQYSNLKQELTELNINRRNITNAIGNLNTANTCYTCGQAIDNSQSITLQDNLEEDLHTTVNSITKKDLELTSLREKLNIYENKLRDWTNNQRTIEKFEQLSQFIDSSIPNQYPDFNELKQEVKSLKTELWDQEKRKNDATEHNEKIKIHNTKTDALIEQKRYFLARQELLNNDILNLKLKIKNLNILRKAFSTTGIVAYKLENLTKELETVINNYLSELSDGQFQVVFRLTGEKLNIIVINNGQESPIETVSGGEFSRIQTAILLAIRNILSKIGGNYINLLFLDEITGVLDEAGKEKLIELLQNEENLNIFLISHDFTHPLIDKLSIYKENNISTIER
jgi:DNA repair exonuclease SbcCD ATPase subunit